MTSWSFGQLTSSYVLLFIIDCISASIASNHSFFAGDINVWQVGISDRKTYNFYSRPGLTVLRIIGLPRLVVSAIGSMFSSSLSSPRAPSRLSSSASFLFSSENSSLLSCATRRMTSTLTQLGRKTDSSLFVSNGTNSLQFWFFILHPPAWNFDHPPVWESNSITVGFLQVINKPPFSTSLLKFRSSRLSVHTKYFTTKFAEMIYVWFLSGP